MKKTVLIFVITLLPLAVLSGCSSPGAGGAGAFPDEGIVFTLVGAQRVQDIPTMWGGSNGDGTGITIRITNDHFQGTFMLYSFHMRGKASDGIWYDRVILTDAEGKWGSGSAACDSYGDEITVRQGETVTCRVNFPHPAEVKLESLEILWKIDEGDGEGTPAVYPVPAY